MTIFVNFIRDIGTILNRRRFMFGVIVVLAIIMIATVSCTDDSEFTYVELGAAWSQEADRVHIVQSGDNLHKIADKYDFVNWEDILLRNESTLKAKYEKTCSNKSKGYTNNSRRRGTFCNDRYNRPYGNTLKAGWTLIIPSGTAPEAIHEVVLANIEEDANVGLLIDDTGSMGNNVRLVGRFYSAALQRHGRKNVGIWLYSDGDVWKIEDGGFKTSGSTENTHGALKVVAKARPDVIILITDEIGDDWNWSEVDDLPPVIANCIPDENNSCTGSMSRVATETGGQYVELAGF